MTTLNLTVSSELETGRLAEIFKTSSTQDREALMALASYFERLASGNASGTVSVSTSATAPVAATGTYTCASVIATDAVTVGGVTLTFTATPTTTAHVLVTVPSALAFASSTDISIVTGLILESAHGYSTGEVGRLTTSSALPTGFAASTDYFVIAISTGTYKLASSLANALAGIAIIPTAVGTGNQTFTLTEDTWIARTLAAAINANATASALVTGSYAAGVVTVKAKQKGLVGNFITLTSADATITASAATLTGGTGGAGTTEVVYTR